MPYLSKWTIQENYNTSSFKYQWVSRFKSKLLKIVRHFDLDDNRRDRRWSRSFNSRNSRPATLSLLFFFFFLFSPPTTHRTLFLPPTFDCHRFIQLSFTDKRPGSPIVLAEHWMRSAISIQHLFHQPAWNYFERFHWPLNKTNNADVYWAKVDNVDKRGEIVF